LVAEVQSVHQDGAASLHTRSLKYGKLRNGVFLSVSGAGGGGGVVRSRRQVWTVDTGTRGGQVDIILGVNGYIWISKHVAPQADVSITRIEESVPTNVYSSQNDEVGPGTRREIARIAGCITSLVEGGVKVDEEMVMSAYEASVEVEHEDQEESWEGDSLYLGGGRGKKVVELALEKMRS
jgi:exosome complex component RRP4